MQQLIFNNQSIKDM